MIYLKQIDKLLIWIGWIYLICTLYVSLKFDGKINIFAAAQKTTNQSWTVNHQNKFTVEIFEMQMYL